MNTITFKAKPYQAGKDEKVASGLMLRLPLAVSKKLPSRGMTLVKGLINHVEFQAVLEPDGEGSHWFQIKPKLQKEAKLKAGATASLSITPDKDWPEPKVPSVLTKALSKEPNAKKIWAEITPMARWDWIRWISAAKLQKTRDHRLEVAISKLNSGMRRACCFNRNECTLTQA